MRGLKGGVLMLVVLGAVTFGGYVAKATVVSYQDPSVAARISELLAQIKWLQDELLKLQAEIGNNPQVIIPVPEKNLPPVINGLSGPTSLKVGEAGTFSVNAYDPENKTLYYLIKWGDEPKNFALDYQGTATTALVQTQKSTYTHSYASQGNYTINVEVSDDVGNTAKSSLTVSVSVGSSQTLKVLYPNGSESLQRYSYAYINWTDINEPVNIYVSRDYPIYDCTYVCPMTAMYPNPDTLILANVLPDTNNDVDYASWQVGTYYFNGYGYIPEYNYGYIPDGNYKIKVCGVQSGTCDSSDYDFNIYSWVMTNGKG